MNKPTSLILKIRARRLITIASLGPLLIAMCPPGRTEESHGPKVKISADTQKAAAQETSFSVPDKGFFAGVGVSASFYNFGNLNSYAQGVTRGYSLVYQTPYVGSASGNTNPNIPDSTNGSVAAQLGYYQRFAPASKWIWGVKATYAALGSQSQRDRLLVPQSGGYTPPVGAGQGQLTGNVVIESIKAKVSNQFGVLPVFGRTYKRGFIYAGAGPTMSQTTFTNSGVDGTAINVETGKIESITDRNRYEFSSTTWVVGWQVSMGATYFIDRATFLDLSYSYAQTGYQSVPYAAPFRGFVPRAGLLDDGTLSGNTNGSIANQSIVLTLNRRF